MGDKQRWKNAPEEHDYAAAANYLSLVLDEAIVTRVVDDMRSAPLSHRQAKDILRASGLAALGPDNEHVGKDLAKVHDGERLSPVLLVRGRLATGMPLVVADGYHRICASYYLDENSDIPCRIADLL